MNDLAWRKFPVNTIRNEDLDYIAFLLPDEMKAAPFMFYMTAICKCDDDGVFDLEDGMIFSRLMRMGSPEQVLLLATYMAQRKIITQVIPESTIYMITDWDAPDRRNAIKSKTAEERRAIIAAKIEAEHKARMQAAPKNIQFEKPVETWYGQPPRDFAPAPAPAPSFEPAPNEPYCIFSPLPSVDWNELQRQRAQNDTFFCALNDKNAENVVKTERERDREIPRETKENTESKKETHTEDTEDMRGEASRVSGPTDGPTAPLAEEKSEERPEEDQTDGRSEEAMDTTASKLADEAIGKVGETEKAIFMPEELKELEDIAVDFFVRNSLIFQKEYDQEAINTLVDRVIRLKTPKNPASTVMKTILRQFKIRATTKGDYFYNCKITPQFLLTENTWHHILQQASALLLTHKEGNEEWSFQLHSKNPEEQRAISNDIEAECLQYGVSPDDPARLSKIMAAKALAAAGNRTNTG